jgi:anaphase-promoting complex subunit 2
VDGTHDELIEDFTSGEIINEEMSDSEDEDREPEKWVPDPIDANPKTSPWKRRHADAITMLVSIYKRRDIFANEFHTVLADRLLNANDYNIDKEVSQSMSFFLNHTHLFL